MAPRATRPKAAARSRRATVLERRPSGPRQPRTVPARPASGSSVRKTYKLYIGGAFPRTESGRAYEVFDARGRLLANACRGTRKDIRDAVAPRERRSRSGWRDRLQPRQILYRIAELMEGRRDQFIAEVMDAEGMARRRATRAGGRRHRSLGLVRRLGGQVLSRRWAPSTR